MESLSANLLDKGFRNMERLSDCWDTIILYVMWATLTQSFNSFVALIAKFSTTEPSSSSDIWQHAVNDFKISIRGTYIKSEKLSSTSWTLSVWPTKVSKFFLKLSNILFWMDLCPRRDLQKNKDKNVDRKAYNNFSIHLLKPSNQCFSTPLILITSFHLLLEHWRVWRIEVNHKWNFYSLISR